MKDTAADFTSQLAVVLNAAVDGQILRAKYECWGCSHPRHGANGCAEIPKFTRGETKCACPGELP